jgi:hypothetical protein
MIDSLETMKAELRHLVQLLRPHYPEETDDELTALAMDMRPKVYAKGCLPTDEEIKRRKAAEIAAKKAAEMLAEAKAAEANAAI